MTPGEQESLASAERVAAVLRERILTGELEPDARLREIQLASEFGISRNTLREGLRLLVSEGIVAQEHNRGAVVARIDAERVRDIYRVRRVLESQAIAASPFHDQSRLDGLAEQLEATEAAARRADWRAVGTASLRFHQALVGLLDSPLCERFFAGLAAQLRLSWAAVRDAAEFQRQWPERDRDLFELISTGHIEHASGVLNVYLEDSERLVLAALRSAP